MNIISSVLHHLVLSPQAPAQDIWVSVKLGWPEMKTEETSADAFLLQFSHSEVVDGNAVEKSKSSPGQVTAVFVGDKAVCLGSTGHLSSGQLLCFWQCRWECSMRQPSAGHCCPGAPCWSHCSLPCPWVQRCQWHCEKHSGCSSHPVPRLPEQCLGGSSWGPAGLCCILLVFLLLHKDLFPLSASLSASS